MDPETLYTCVIILCLFVGGFLLKNWSIRREDQREKEARSDTRIKSDMVKEKTLTDKTARESRNRKSGQRQNGRKKESSPAAGGRDKNSGNKEFSPHHLQLFSSDRDGGRGAVGMQGL